MPGSWRKGWGGSDGLCEQALRFLALIVLKRGRACGVENGAAAAQTVAADLAAFLAGAERLQGSVPVAVRDLTVKQ